MWIDSTNIKIHTKTQVFTTVDLSYDTETRVSIAVDFVDDTETLFLIVLHLFVEIKIVFWYWNHNSLQQS